LLRLASSDGAPRNNFRNDGDPVGCESDRYDRRVLEISRNAYDRMIGLALDEYPLEACGLIAGGGPDKATEFHACVNLAESARVYTIDPKDHLRIERDVEDRELEITGVVHSHTHSEPYPSPTDVAAAPDPDWHYVIIGLKRDAPEVRSYRIIDGEIVSEPLTIL
jgi:[CysO sulfur-carrier protein]-S-L-cysteine hydrolase